MGGRKTRSTTRHDTASGGTMSPQSCDHESVGILAHRGDKLLLIERRKPPYGFAPPAGHVDGDPRPETAAFRELEEEVGLKAHWLHLIAEGARNNPCRRPDGSWHYWRIYQTQAAGGLRLSPDETRQGGWYDRSELEHLAARTRQYLAGGIREEDWERAPGLEPVWLDWLTELGLLQPA